MSDNAQQLQIAIERRINEAFNEGINLAINFFGNGLNEEEKQKVHNQILQYELRVKEMRKSYDSKEQ